MKQPTGKRIFLAAIVGALLLALLLRFDAVWQGLKSIVTVLRPLLFGVVLALAVDSLVSGIERRLFAKQEARWRRPVSVLIAWAVIAATVIGLLWFSLPDIIATLTQIVQNLPAYLEKAAGYLEQVSAELGVTLFAREAIIQELAGSLEQLGQSMSVVVVTLYDFLKNVFSFFLGLVFSVYVLLDKEQIKKAIRQLLCGIFKEKTGKSVFGYIEICADTFKAFVGGQVVEAVILGVLCFAGMSIIRLPFAPVISVLIGFTSIIPVLGSYLGTIPSVLLLLLENPVQALIFLIFIVALQQFENVVIYPKVVGNAIGIGGLLVFVGVILGAGFGGVGGLLIGVPLVAVLHAVLGRILAERAENKKTSKE